MGAPSSYSGRAELTNPFGPEVGASYELGAVPLTIGRTSDCSLSLADPGIEPHHACVEARPDGHYLTDLHSAAGTFVNDRRVDVHRLQNGDYVRVG